MKLATNISIPAHWYFLFFASLLNIKNVNPLTAIEKAINTDINKFIKSLKSYIFFSTAFSSDIGIPKYAMKS